VQRYDAQYLPHKRINTCFYTLVVVGEIAREQEMEGRYDLPQMKEVVSYIAVSRDGTTTPILQEGYRETMCGILSFYSSKGERMQTIYTACAPEYGKSSFNTVMDTYFENNLGRMNYAKYEKLGYPIGSGVTQAACKVVAKQRLSNSGMRWTIDAAQYILLLRGLIRTEGRWQQFWNHIDKNGL
jgi:hypothetical protein